MKDNFRGWNSVYAFTFRQSTKGAGFKIVTTLVAILIMAAFIAINIFVAKPDEDSKKEPSPIKYVYVLDNSGLQPTNYKEIIIQLSEEQFKDVEFIAESGRSVEEVVKTAGAKSDASIAVIVTFKEGTYEMNAYIPDGSELKKKHAEAILEPMSTAFESNKLMQVGLSQEQLMSVLKPSVVSFTKVGEATNEITQVIKMLVPMLFSFMLFFILLVYGQDISKSVSTEKTSKLVETLLTSVHPYALITGKVLAITSMALMQFAIWIAAGIMGLYGGNAIAGAMYPNYENPFITIINFLKDNIGETAMSLPAVIMAVIMFFLGVLFYSVISALTGCFVSKPEDVAYTQAVSTYLIMFSWLFTYFPPIMGKEGIVRATRYIPFTSPFNVPADLITGNIGLGHGIVSIVILLVFCLLIVVLGGRIYKSFILYNGEKLSLKMIGNVLKAHK
ncbi:ABC transporter permease [Clostridium thermarum]|uniref:ABC transporter permease n=1 Tax=Clostridium thermarum TaxID=1716543 RepID=UPI00111F6DBA|nr:ABC transporter permease [Clostridium thermarum]